MNPSPWLNIIGSRFMSLFSVQLRNIFLSSFRMFFSSTSMNFQNYTGRNAILRGICPQVFGLFTVKLAGRHSLSKCITFVLVIISFNQHFHLKILNSLCWFFIYLSCINTYWRCATCWCFWDKGTRRVSFTSCWWPRWFFLKFFN